MNGQLTTYSGPGNVYFSLKHNREENINKAVVLSKSRESEHDITLISVSARTGFCSSEK